MNIQEILKNISVNYGLIEKENNFFIKYDEKGEEADFFHYVFDKQIIEKNLKDGFESYSKDLGEKFIKKGKDNMGEKKQLNQIDSFDKNLNLIILLKLEESENHTDELKKQIYQIEENPYYSNKFVLVYTEEQIKNYNSINVLEIIKNENQELQGMLKKIKNSTEHFIPEQFVFDLLTVLSFIKVSFNNDSGVEKQIYSNAQKEIQNDIKINLNKEVYRLFNENYTEFDNGDIDIMKISKFEKELIEFGDKLLINNSDYKVEEILNINLEEKNG